MIRTVIERTPSRRFRWRLINFLEEPISSGICQSRQQAEVLARSAKIEYKTVHQISERTHSPFGGKFSLSPLFRSIVKHG